MEEGSVRSSATGTPQGGVVSPILANVYLHEVLDMWFEETAKPALSGQAFLVRYCDDAVMVWISSITTSEHPGSISSRRRAGRRLNVR